MNPIKSLAERILRPELTTINNALRKIAGRSVMQEATLHDLQRELRGWQMLSGTSGKFSREDIDAITEMCRTACLKNPLALRYTAIMTYYTFAQGVTIKTEDTANDTLQTFITDHRNARELFGHVGQNYADADLNSTGNLFVMRIADAAPVPQIRVLPVEQFREIVCDPEDGATRWLYLRRSMKASLTGGTPTEVKAWHPDGGLDEGTLTKLRTQIGDRYRDAPVEWKRPVSHYAIGGFGHWKWGIPPVYAAHNWLVAHNQFLTDVSQVMSALSRYAAKITGEGMTGDQLAAAKSLLQSTWASDVNADEINPPMAAGSTWISDSNTKLEAYQARGMHLDPADGKQFALMAFAAFGLPAHFFGDVDQGNLATAQSMDRPTELLFRHRQELWTYIYQNEAEWGLRVQGKRGAAGTKADGLKVQVDFPPILSHDPDKLMSALVKGLTLGGSPLAPMFSGSGREMAREILATLDIDGRTIEALLDAIYDEQGNLINPPAPTVVPAQFVPQESRRADLIRSVQTLVQAVSKQRAA